MSGPDSGDGDDEENVRDHERDGSRSDDPDGLDDPGRPDDFGGPNDRSGEPGRRSLSDDDTTPGYERDEDNRRIGGRSGFDDPSSPLADSESDNATDDRVTIEDDGIVRWFLNSDDGAVVVTRDIASSVAIVAVIGLLLFGISGVWPPLVAVESGSMEPNMERGDLIFIVDDDRFVGDDPIEGTGIVTAESGLENGHERFGESGDVIIFRPDGDDHRTPVIHRAHFWVEEDENWIDRADEDFVGDATCDDVQTCPANHAGFVTKGDANSGYDQYQSGARTDVVKDEWVTGKAIVRIPWLGHIRLIFDTILGGMFVPLGIDGGSVAGVGSATQAGLAGAAAGIAGTGAGLAVAAGGRRE